MRLAMLIGLGFVGIASPAFAQGMTASKPGLMCEDADALARLTLPDGSSRIGTAKSRPDDAALKQRGRCLDIPLGAHVTALNRRKNTTVVEYLAKGGPPQGLYLFVPNIDFTFDPEPVLPPAPDASAGCHAPGRLKVSGLIHMRTLPPDPDMNRQRSWTYPVMTFDRSVCVTDGGFGAVPRGHVASVIIYPALDLHLHEGEHVTLTGDLTPPDNGNQPPEELMLFVGQ